MNCEQCDEMLTQPPTNRTTAEIYAVITHITGCTRCLFESEKRQIQADWIEKNVLTKQENEEIDAEIQEIIEKIFNDKELAGKQEKQLLTKVQRWN